MGDWMWTLGHFYEGIGYLLAGLGILLFGASKMTDSFYNYKFGNARQYQIAQTKRERGLLD